jgi:hypothetical protein
MIGKFNTDNINVDTHIRGFSKISNNTLKIVANPIINVNF